MSTTSEEGKDPPPHGKTLNQSILEAARVFIPRAKQTYSEELKKKILAQGNWATPFIGDLEHAPTRIAFWAIVFSFVAVIFSAFISNPGLADKIVTAAFAIISAALGFVFGQKTK